MALTTAGKNFVAQKAFVDETIYIGLHVDSSGSAGAELSGNGYARKSWGSSEKTLNSTTSTITNSSDLILFTATTASAQDAQHMVIYDAASGGNALTTARAFTTNIAAPANGQALVVRATQLSIDF